MKLNATSEHYPQGDPMISGDSSIGSPNMPAATMPSVPPVQRNTTDQTLMMMGY